ncbi:hypothetical protein [Actinomadura sp. CNU-125]|uniref:hypothetical protein n=1 Tax=Actinomadura sp. CNU-125 TaxID=1904961 RepID=UPI001178235E|nr:hypothetical protein [Actinomadura sp. CNU-125]
MHIISRPARDLRAGDIIVRDPDPNHHGQPVRWRVHSRPTTGPNGVTIVDYWDIADEPRPGIGHYQAGADVHVEPVGGAQ